MLTIDGSQGEGGGQILRTSLALALVTGQAFRLENIRAGRAKPGLMRQHLTAVEAAAKIGGAHLEGAAIGSRKLVFKPGTIKPGKYDFAVGTAGSVTLVLQTILPPLLTASGASELTLEGGTHNPFAPPWDFLAKAFLPLVNRMGPNVETQLERHGFYPAGGGKFTVKVTPCVKLQPFRLLERGEIRSRRARALVSNLPPNIANRELKVVAEKLGWSRENLAVEEIRGSRGPGNVLILEMESADVTEVCTGFGEKSVTAEAVAGKAVEEARAYLAFGVPVGANLADQLMLPLALSGGGAFVTQPLTRHAQTNLDVMRMFLGERATIVPLDNRCVRVEFR